MSDLDIQRRIKDVELRAERLRKSDGGYVPGTWTPTLVGSGTTGTFTYAGTTAGTYIVVAGTVWLWGRLGISVVTVAPVGNLSIGGLPVTASTTAHDMSGIVSFVYWGSLNLGGGANVHLGGWIRSAASAIALTTSSNNGGGAQFLTAATASVTAGTDLIFAGSYQIV